MTHTPGPWSIQHFNDEPTACICAGEGDIRVLTLEANCSDAEHDANARLIAAAPELLEALEAAHAYLGDNECAMQDSGNWGDAEQDLLETLQAAIAKAKGQS